MELYSGTVPENITLFAGTDLANNTLFDGTVPENNTLFAGIEVCTRGEGGAN